MKSTACLAMAMLAVAAPGFPSEPETRREGTPVIGIDAGASGFRSDGGLAYAFNLGYLEPRGKYLGLEFANSREFALGIGMGRRPTEGRFEASLMLGNFFRAKRAYLKASGGIGYFRDVRRGKQIDEVPDIYEKDIRHGVGFPLEMSFGYLHVFGAGLKARWLVGQDSRLGILAEFMVSPLPDQSP